MFSSWQAWQSTGFYTSKTFPNITKLIVLPCLVGLVGLVGRHSGPKLFCRRIVTRWVGKAASTMDSDTVAALADYIFHGWTEGRESAGCVSWTDYCTLISSYFIICHLISVAHLYQVCEM